LFASRSAELGHGALGQTGSIRLLGVERRHLAAGPTEDRIQFRHRGAVVRSADGADLADPVRALIDARGVASIAEIRSERILDERLALRAADEGEIAAVRSL
jgi:hypothetical protein